MIWSEDKEISKLMDDKSDKIRRYEQLAKDFGEKRSEDFDPTISQERNDRQQKYRRILSEGFDLSAKKLKEELAEEVINS
jgi:hypothetical protein